MNSLFTLIFFEKHLKNLMLYGRYLIWIVFVFE